MTASTKQSQLRTFTIRDVTVVGMMSAVIFAATFFLRIPITLPNGDATQLKAANALCLLSGFLLGPVRGGLAAGFGSMLFDLTNPLYIRSAPFTFVFFFLMGYICGLAARGGSAAADPSNMIRNLLAACAGAFSYVFLYLSKSFLSLVIAGSAPAAAIAATLPKAAASLTNAVFAIVVSLLLLPILHRSLRRLLY